MCKLRLFSPGSGSQNSGSGKEILRKLNILNGSRKKRIFKFISVHLTFRLWFHAKCEISMLDNYKSSKLLYHFDAWNLLN